MDPNACMRLLIDAIHDNEPDEIREHAGNLLQWISGGGFLPVDYSPELPAHTPAGIAYNLGKFAVACPAGLRLVAKDALEDLIRNIPD